MVMRSVSFLSVSFVFVGRLPVAKFDFCFKIKGKGMFRVLQSLAGGRCEMLRVALTSRLTMLARIAVRTDRCESCGLTLIVKKRTGF
jgi:hypothetical protein